ncbi:MAG: hypothetical protein IPL59_08400 [Candidatus Competibacteraceae bacterium]|nr:hypothetical protein [Candidatus Competibacteraceae bacterium]
MPGQRTRLLDWPYVEGLRMDEAMNPLFAGDRTVWQGTPQSERSAAARLVVPWKYGFKASSPS